MISNQSSDSDSSFHNILHNDILHTDRRVVVDISNAYHYQYGGLKM